MYAAFVNIMDANSLQMRKKFQFEQAPLERSMGDYYQQQMSLNLMALSGKSVHELELEMKNRGNEIMM